MEITKKEHKTLLDALANELYLPVFDPSVEVTTSTLAKRTGRDTKSCRRILEEKVTNGEYEKRQVKMLSGNEATAYRKLI